MDPGRQTSSPSGYTHYSVFVSGVLITELLEYASPHDPEGLYLSTGHVLYFELADQSIVIMQPEASSHEHQK